MAVSKDLASIEKLNNSNYSNWSFKIENLLVKFDLLKYIIEEPPETPDAAYLKSSGRAKTIINLCIADDLIIHVKDLKTHQTDLG